MSALATIKRFQIAQKRQPKGHGQHIYAYCNVRTNQVLYSLTQTLNSHQSLKQLPQIGPNTVPPNLRKDLWSPLWTCTFPDPPNNTEPPNAAKQNLQGLDAFRKLREYRLLHEHSWRPPEELSRPYNEKQLEELQERLDERGGSKKESVYDLVKREKKKVRQRVVMDQRANSVADLAAVLSSQETAGVETEETVAGRREQARKQEVEEMLALASQAGRGGLQKIQGAIQKLEENIINTDTPTMTLGRGKARRRVDFWREKMKKMLFAQKAVALVERWDVPISTEEVEHLHPARKKDVYRGMRERWVEYVDRRVQSAEARVENLRKELEELREPASGDQVDTEVGADTSESSRSAATERRILTLEEEIRVAEARLAIVEAQKRAVSEAWEAMFKAPTDEEVTSADEIAFREKMAAIGEDENASAEEKAAAEEEAAAKEEGFAVKREIAAANVQAERRREGEKRIRGKIKSLGERMRATNESEQNLEEMGRLLQAAQLEAYTYFLQASLPLIPEPLSEEAQRHLHVIDFVAQVTGKLEVGITGMKAHMSALETRISREQADEGKEALQRDLATASSRLQEMEKKLEAVREGEKIIADYSVPMLERRTSEAERRGTQQIRGEAAKEVHARVAELKRQVREACGRPTEKVARELQDARTELGRLEKREREWVEVCVRTWGEMLRGDVGGVEGGETGMVEKVSPSSPTGDSQVSERRKSDGTWLKWWAGGEGVANEERKVETATSSWSELDDKVKEEIKKAKDELAVIGRREKRRDPGAEEARREVEARIKEMLGKPKGGLEEKVPSASTATSNADLERGSEGDDKAREDLRTRIKGAKDELTAIGRKDAPIRRKEDQAAEEDIQALRARVQEAENELTAIGRKLASTPRNMGPDAEEARQALRARLKEAKDELAVIGRREKKGDSGAEEARREVEARIKEAEGEFDVIDWPGRKGDKERQEILETQIKEATDKLAGIERKGYPGVEEERREVKGRMRSLQRGLNDTSRRANSDARPEEQSLRASSSRSDQHSGSMELPSSISPPRPAGSIDYHSLLPSFPQPNPYHLHPRNPLRSQLLKLNKPIFTTEGVTVKWQNILDAEFAESWPENVQHEYMGITRYTAPKPTKEALMSVDDIQAAREREAEEKMREGQRRAEELRDSGEGVRRDVVKLLTRRVVNRLKGQDELAGKAEYEARIAKKQARRRLRQRREDRMAARRRRELMARSEGEGNGDGPRHAQLA